jgi:uncharacterized protein involved in exopolysaccharide biosynthesis
LHGANRGLREPEIADSDLMGQPPPRRPGAPIHPYRAYRILRAGRWWLLLAAVLGLLAGVATARVLFGDTYVATAVLKLEGERPMGTEPRTNLAEVGSLSEAFLIAPVLGRAKKELGWDVPLLALRASLQVEPNVTAGTVHVSATAETAEDASALAAAVTDAFMQYHRDRREEQLRADVAGMERRLDMARQAVTEARGAYDAFRDAHGIADLSAEQQRGIESAARLRAQRDMAESDIAALEARIAQLRTEVRSAPRMEVSATQATAEARELAETEAELAAARGTLSEDHPRVQALERRMGTLRLRLHSGRAQRQGLEQLGASSRRATLEMALSESQAELQSAQQRLASLDGLATQARARVEAMSEVEGEATALLSQVRTRERVVSDLEAELARMGDLLSEPTSGFRVLTAATLPEAPEPSRRKKAAAMAMPVLFVLLTACVLLGRELWGMRVWTAAEVAYWGGGPVIGATSWPEDPHGLETLAADLDDVVPASAGEMLVVGINERAGGLAREVAEWLRDDWTDTRLLVDGGGPVVAPSAHAQGMQETGHALAAPAVATSHLVIVSDPTPPHGPDGRALPPAVDAPGAMGGRLQVRPWLGPAHGQGLRRAARLADRVLVAVPAGEATAAELLATRTRLGRSHGVAFVLLNLPTELARLADRVGPVDAFWDLRKG